MWNDCQEAKHFAETFLYLEKLTSESGAQKLHLCDEVQRIAQFEHRYNCGLSAKNIYT